MQQWRLPRGGAGLDALALQSNVPIPTPSGSQMVVRMKALSVNYRDYVIATQQLFPDTLDNVVPLSDGAGEVSAVGEECTRFKVGDRVALTLCPNNLEGDQSEGIGLQPCRGGSRQGVAAEYVLTDEVDAVRIPDYMTYAEAAALPCAGVTAWSALNSAAQRLVPGSVVLVEGTGGVSVLAAQLAHAAGCRVLAVSSSKAKMEPLLGRGLVRDSDWLNYREQPKWGEAVQALTPDGRGVDVVVEVVGMSSMNESVACTRRRGTIAVIGHLNASQPPEGFRLDLVLMKRLHVVGVHVGPRRDFEDMLQLMAAREVHPILDPHHFTLAELPRALELMTSQQHIGKIIITV
ncbi:Alcohol dehydrogenase GroES-like domain/Zinc-binding dehydrogenase [Novymonas esmeraldas]|uniref:Alcohol dehydrogenase GroES-like domain/Zinc-binding dehydrogenase n=1 Tax=Novymonas esmeraldas TaxID=1808958 RepID=A0AAW0ESS6_9TRYP